MNLTDENIIIAGASGLLGTELSKFFHEKKIAHKNLSKNSDTEIICDLTSLTETLNLFEKYKPTILINLVALTDVDRCEVNINEAYKINTKTVENIVQASKNLENFFLIHISTDQIYDNINISKECDIHIKNNYALTKYAAEIAAKQVSSIILRTNFFGKGESSKQKSFSDWIIENLENNNEITLFDDVFFNPLHFNTLCNLILLAASKKFNGVYNVGNRTPVSKSDFAKKIANNFNLSLDNAIVGSVDDINLKAYRPKNMAMDCSHFEKMFNIKLPNLDEEIKKI